MFSVSVLTSLPRRGTCHEAPSSSVGTRWKTCWKTIWEILCSNGEKQRNCGFYVAKNKHIVRPKASKPTRIHLRHHLPNQDVDPAGYGLQHVVRNPLCDDVAAPRDVLFPGRRRQELSDTQTHDGRPATSRRSGSQIKPF